MKTLRVVFLLACAGLVLFGLFLERHRVLGLLGGEPQVVGGAGLTERAAYDGIMLRDGRLYDPYSLAPASADLRDCKT
jgi:hypothetical protein